MGFSIVAKGWEGDIDAATCTECRRGAEICRAGVICDWATGGKSFWGVKIDFGSGFRGFMSGRREITRRGAGR